MKIAIISDIHDNSHNTVMFFEQVKKYNQEIKFEFNKQKWHRL